MPSPLGHQNTLKQGKPLHAPFLFWQSDTFQCLLNLVGSIFLGAPKGNMGRKLFAIITNPLPMELFIHSPLEIKQLWVVC
jgi:hypothetical protein